MVSGNAKFLIGCLFRNSYARRHGDNLMQLQKNLRSCANGTKRRLFRGWTSPSVTQGAPINLGEPFTQQLWSKEPRSEGTRRCTSASASFHRASGEKALLIAAPPRLLAQLTLARRPRLLPRRCACGFGRRGLSSERKACPHSPPHPLQPPPSQLRGRLLVLLSHESGSQARGPRAELAGH